MEQELIPISDGRKRCADRVADVRDVADSSHWAWSWLGVVSRFAASAVTTAAVTAVMMAAIILRMVIVRVMIVAGVVAVVFTTAPRLGFVDIHLHEW